MIATFIHRLFIIFFFFVPWSPRCRSPRTKIPPRNPRRTVHLRSPGNETPFSTRSGLLPPGSPPRCRLGIPFACPLAVVEPSRPRETLFRCSTCCVVRKRKKRCRRCGKEAKETKVIGTCTNGGDERRCRTFGSVGRRSVPDLSWTEGRRPTAVPSVCVLWKHTVCASELPRQVVGTFQEKQMRGL